MYVVFAFRTPDELLAAHSNHPVYGKANVAHKSRKTGLGYVLVEVMTLILRVYIVHKQTNSQPMCL